MYVVKSVIQRLDRFFKEAFEIDDRKAFAWAPTFAWCGVILFFTILPTLILVALFPSSTHEIRHIISYLADIIHQPSLRQHGDEVIHFAFYTVFGALILISFYISRGRSLPRDLSATFMFGGFYGLFTEFLQRFIPTRSSCVADAAANLMGIACGVLLVEAAIALWVLFLHLRRNIGLEAVKVSRFLRSFL